MHTYMCRKKNSKIISQCNIACVILKGNDPLIICILNEPIRLLLNIIIFQKSQNSTMKFKNTLKYLSNCKTIRNLLS